MVYKGQHTVFGPPGVTNYRTLYQNGSGFGNSIFGPPGVTNYRDLYQNGAGFGSFMGSLFKKIIPMAGKAVKKIAKSSIVKEGAKELLNTAGNTATTVISDIIEGNDPKESLHENLNVARKQIASSIRNANKRRIDIADEIQPKRPKSSKKKLKTKRKSVKYSIFNNG